MLDLSNSAPGNSTDSTSMSGRASTKVLIPHPTEPKCSVVGILENLSPEAPTHGRKLALILHGTMGHKDYLFQKRLALRLPMDSFRFDFRGNHETPGTWRQGAIEDDMVDLFTVVEYLKTTYGYVIDLVVGHSRGSLVGFRWLCTSKDAANVSGFVNASGRYRMRKILESPSAKMWQESFEREGHHTWSVSVAGKLATVKIYPQDLEQFTNWDTSLVWDQFPSTIDVLTLHGLSDKTVPPYDAIIYARALSGRTPGTHTLNMLEDADHNFTGRQDEVADAILDWWMKRQRRELKTGVWLEGFRGKL